MPNLPFFSFQTSVLPPANAPTPLASASKTQPSPVMLGPIDNGLEGSVEEPQFMSFMQTLNEELALPVLPLQQTLIESGQNIAAQESDLALNERLVEQEIQAPVLTTSVQLDVSPLTQAPTLSPMGNKHMALQDIQMQRDAKPVLQSHQAGVFAQAQAKTSLLPNNALTTETETRLQTPALGLSPFSVNQESMNQESKSQDSINQAALTQGALKQPPLNSAMPNQLSSINEAVLNGEQATAMPVNPNGIKGQVLKSPININESQLALEAELELQPLHEKPITLMPKNAQELAPLPNQFTQLNAQAAEQTVETVIPGHQNQISKGSQSEMVASEKIQSNESLADTKAQFKLQVPPQSPQWSEQIAKRIGIMNGENIQTARIQLDPPELGMLEIKIKVQHDQVNVAFTSNQHQVRDALEAQSPRLREMLEQQGINLADVNVSDQSKQSAQGQGSEFAQDGSPLDGSAEGEESEASGELISSDSLVDYFA